MTNTSTTTVRTTRVIDLENRLQIMWLITEADSNGIKADYRTKRLILAAMWDGEITEAEADHLIDVFGVAYCDV